MASQKNNPLHKKNYTHPMNFEHLTPATEKEPYTLSLAEIKAKIEVLCGQEDPKILRALEDERGVYLYEVVTTDNQGDASVFSYRRAGDSQESKVANTLVDVAYFVGPLEDDMPMGGTTLSNYDEMTGEWSDEK
jgi:hypothetical protein